LEKDLFVIWLFCHLKNATYTNVFKLVTKFTPKTAKFTPPTPPQAGGIKTRQLVHHHLSHNIQIRFSDNLDVCEHSKWDKVSAMSYELSPISYELSAMSYVLSPISYHLQTTSYEL
jgi:hypothetical protein